MNIIREEQENEMFIVNKWMSKAFDSVLENLSEDPVAKQS